MNSLCRLHTLRQKIGENYAFISLCIQTNFSSGCIAPEGCFPSVCETLRLTLIPQNKTTFLVI